MSGDRVDRLRDTRFEDNKDTSYTNDKNKEAEDYSVFAGLFHLNGSRVLLFNLRQTQTNIWPTPVK